MTNKIEEIKQEMFAYMDARGTNSIPCSVLAQIASKHGHTAGEVVTFFLEAKTSAA